MREVRRVRFTSRNQILVMRASCQELAAESLRVMTTVLVVNFNGPELNELARHLATRERLAAFVRPYVNRGRAWERGGAALPLLGGTSAETFGRRRIEDPRLLVLTYEAGVLADFAAAAVARFRGLPTRVRRRWTHGLHDALRQAVSETAADRGGAAQC